ncbi:Zn-dependent protease with chaperone function [Serratia fonticola]|uniref:Zn-dependent protease with chaperone function n=1 Tax=Serratia fonticola TaxID=47917 RepID=A0A542BLR9_SERFO|nr:M48 family metallopeptidase [Serratia fonticola]TQI79522.1 Zn-dependent protease with chaperone function [Serratia fonticola]TQI98453.1 Zn-dependent protease with chaperone function [Serratia fonticola]TVZ67981.1 Zn-dependent protease with chaperone function [Serratia fonticola]
MILEGYYQYPGRAARETARLVLNDAGESIALQRGRERCYYSLAQVSVSASLGSIPLTLTFPDGGRFVPADDALFRQWFYQHRSPGLVHRLERYKRGVLLTLLLSILFTLSYLYLVLPWASSEIAQRIPTTAEQRLGKHTFEFLQQSGFKPSQLPAEKQQAVQKLFLQVMPEQMQHERTPLRLKLMASPLEANAFMLPDGTLVISDDLVKLATHDDGLAAVMLHEMGHHAYRHSMRMVVRSSLVALTFMWMTGDVSGIGDTLLQSASFMHEMQFSRTMEREADEWAIAEMQRQGRSLLAMENFYRALQQAVTTPAAAAIEMPEWLSTHPDMQARLEAIEAARKKRRDQ